MHGQNRLKPHWRWLCDLLGWEMNKAELLYCYRQWVDMMCLSLAYQQSTESNKKYPLQCATTWKDPTRCENIISAQFVKSDLQKNTVSICCVRSSNYTDSDIGCFYCITMAMITHCGAWGGQKYCVAVTQTKSDIALGGGTERPEVHLAVNLGHWVRRRDILRVPLLLLLPMLGSSPNRWRLL